MPFPTSESEDTVFRRRLVYIPPAVLTWLLDLEARTNVQITHLADCGALRWFDVTPDGQFLVLTGARRAT
jgi:hypothetical protein